MAAWDGFEHEVIRGTTLDTWIVEAIELPGEGLIYRAEFIGPDAEARAREYADWKNTTTPAAPGRDDDER